MADILNERGVSSSPSSSFVSVILPLRHISRLLINSWSIEFECALPVRQTSPPLFTVSTVHCLSLSLSVSHYAVLMCPSLVQHGSVQCAVYASLRLLESRFFLSLAVKRLCVALNEIKAHLGESINQTDRFKGRRVKGGEGGRVLKGKLRYKQTIKIIQFCTDKLQRCSIL